MENYEPLRERKSHPVNSSENAGDKLDHALAVNDPVIVVDAVLETLKAGGQPQDQALNVLADEIGAHLILNAHERELADNREVYIPENLTAASDTDLRRLRSLMLSLKGKTGEEVEAALLDFKAYTLAARDGWMANQKNKKKA